MNSNNPYSDQLPYIIQTDIENLHKKGIINIKASCGYDWGMGNTKFFKLTKGIVDKSRTLWNSLSPESQLLFKSGILVPASIIAFSHGLVLPDLDIITLGIGWHRHFLFHSAIGVWVLKKFFERYREFIEEKSDGIGYKATGAVLAASALGIGIHLAADGSFGLLDGEKSVVFGFPGIGRIDSIYDGTMVDDNIWLLGNSLWAFKMAGDIAILTFAEEIDLLRKYIQNEFPQNVIKSKNYLCFNNEQKESINIKN